jgi:formate dehydrogenase major subunit
VFGAGGGTSSYEEVEQTDLIVLWGSNARAAHPIFFHHVLKGMQRGAKMVVVDPRRTESAAFADLWLGIDVGTDVALSNTIAREIIHAGLAHTAFVEGATLNFDEYAASVEDWTLERGAEVTGVPAEVIRELAHGFATAERAMICWTLGITEHHNAVDNVLSLINLGLLTGHVGRYGSGLNPLRGQNNVQGGGDMGAIPNKLPGFQDLETDTAARTRFEEAWGVPIEPRHGWHLTAMFEAMERGDLTAVYCIGENPATSEADQDHAVHLLEGLDTLIVQDMFLTKTAQLADVVFPAANSAFETDGTVTNSERRVQRVRKALEPPGEARDDMWIIGQLAKRLGVDWGEFTSEQAWDELRSLSPMHTLMSWQRIEELGGIQWPCNEEFPDGAQFLHERLWAFDDPEAQGPKAPFSVVIDIPPADTLTEEFPMRLTTGRRLESFNTGVQTNAFSSPLHRGESLDLCPEDAVALDVVEGEVVRIVSRRGAIEAPVHLTTALREGLAFMTFHFPDEVATNRITNEAYDPKSGTSEFKATAIRVEKLAIGAGR